MTHGAIASSPLSKTCRAEFLNESTRRGNDIAGSFNDTLAKIATEIEMVKRQEDVDLTAKTLDLAIATIANQEQSFTTADYPKLVTILDQLVALSRTLPSQQALIKAKVFTESGIFYQKTGQSSKARQTLQLATQAVFSISNTQLAVPAQIRTVEALIFVNQTTEAATILNSALAKTLTGVKDANIRRQSLSKLVSLQLQINQPTQALEVLKQLTVQDYEPAIMVTQIAAAYAEAKELSSAQKLLNPLLKEALAIQNIEQREIRLMTLVLHYAPNGDFGRVLQIVSEMKRPNSFRARSWLAIAGEAGKFKQLEVRNQGISRLVADVKAAKIADQFGGRFDNEWYGEMSNLSTNRGYQAELKALIAELRAVNVLSVVLRDLIASKQYDLARQMIPRPMMVQIDGGYFDLSDQWLDEIAIAQLKSGQFQSAEARIANDKSDVRRLVKFAQVFQEKGNRTFADQLFSRAQRITEQVSTPAILYEQAAIVNALALTNRATDQALNRLVKLIQVEKEVRKQADLLFLISKVI
jgi:hypothetical protein